MCMSHLHQFGIAITLYADDNSRKLLDTVQMGGSYRYPNQAYVLKQAGPNYFNAEAITPYLPGNNPAEQANRTTHVSGIWFCPSDIAFTPQSIGSEISVWTVFSFSYAGSHGDNGARSSDPAINNLELGVPNNLAGLNALYGDGRVVWKSGKTMNKAAITPSNPAIGMVRGYGSTVEFY
jgi:hypothetical protein